MWTKHNTAENSPTREFHERIHPSGLRTSGFPIFEPTKRQIESAARRAQDDPMALPRRRTMSASTVALLIGLALIGSYLVVRVFAW